MKAFVCLLSVSSLCFAQSSPYIMSSTRLRYEDALNYCESQSMALADETELQELYRKSIGEDGNSVLRGEQKVVEFWVKGEKSWGLDAWVLLSPILVVPFVSKQARAMKIYRYREEMPETMYIDYKAPWLSGDLSLAICR